MLIIFKIIFLISLLTFVYFYLGKVYGDNIRSRLFDGARQPKSEILIGKIKNLKIISKSMILSGFSAFASLINKNTIIKSLLIGMIAGVMYFLLIRIKEKRIRKEVIQDLLNVTECLRVQLSSQISLKIALRNIPELCKNKAFSSELTNLYFEYELSKFTADNSFKSLTEKYNYPEMQIFISAVNQQIQGTSAIEALDNLMEILKEKYIEYMEDNTKSKVAILSFGVFVIVVNLAALGIYPVVVEIIESTQRMLS